jgi:hypothetical protein
MSTHFTFNDNSITKLVSEPHLDFTAVTIWACEVVTSYMNQSAVLVLGYTNSWIDLGNSWSIVECEISANVLPVLVILIDLDDCVTSVVGWRGSANILDV